MNHIKYICNTFFLVLSTLTVTAYAVEEGSLTVTTDPEGVEVWLDDKYVGDSPIESRKLRAGPPESVGRKTRGTVTIKTLNATQPTIESLFLSSRRQPAQTARVVHTINTRCTNQSSPVTA